MLEVGANIVVVRDHLDESIADFAWIPLRSDTNLWCWSGFGGRGEDPAHPQKDRGDIFHGEGRRQRTTCNAHHWKMEKNYPIVFQNHRWEYSDHP